MAALDLLDNTAGPPSQLQNFVATFVETFVGAAGGDKGCDEDLDKDRGRSEGAKHVQATRWQGSSGESPDGPGQANRLPHSNT